MPVNLNDDDCPSFEYFLLYNKLMRKNCIKNNFGDLHNDNNSRCGTREEESKKKTIWFLCRLISILFLCIYWAYRQFYILSLSFIHFYLSQFFSSSLYTLLNINFLFVSSWEFLETLHSSQFSREQQRVKLWFLFVRCGYSYKKKVLFLIFLCLECCIKRIYMKCFDVYR